MPSITNAEAFSAFQAQLRTLCLDEFPGGIGPWRTSTNKSLPATRFTITLRDYDAGKEQEETLEEYFTSAHSPYNVDTTWSEEAKELREIAVKSPWLIDEGFIYKHFKTLKLIDKNIVDVDNGLNKFKNLTELTLSCNMITTVDSRNLPSKLQVLELCANEISNLSSLCSKPPPLQHLGLGVNKINSIYDYITGDTWPHLLSLDLSYNELCDLIDIVGHLQTLPKLRNLVLHGNPVALIPGYRGFVVDSLRKLLILDDLRITADEKHHFKGLAKKKEFILDEARLTVKIHKVTGIPVPEEIKNPEEQPEFPLIERNYYVEFMFLEGGVPRPPTQDREEGGTESPPLTADRADTQQLETPANLTPAIYPDGGRVMVETPRSEQTPTVAAATNPRSGPGTPLDSPVPSPRKDLKLAAVTSNKLPWTSDEEGLEFKFSCELVADNLPVFKQFLKENILFTIKEEKILSYPADEERKSAASSGKKDGKQQDKGGKGGKDATKDKAKDAKGGGKDAKDAKKKKKGEPEIELNHLPAQITELGSCLVSTEEFIEGEYHVQELCKCSGEDAQTNAREKSAGSTRNKKDGKKRSESAKKKQKDKSAAADKDKGKKGVKEKDAKKDGGKQKADEDLEEEGEQPAPPLMLQVEIELQHWESAAEATIKPRTVDSFDERLEEPR